MTVVRKRQIGHRITQPAHSLEYRRPSFGSPHPFQDAIRSVLNRHVQVRQNARLTRHHLDQLARDAGGVHVEQTQPRNPRFT